jgi:CobQ-like glutamine amidotransferase family enzyme
LPKNPHFADLLLERALQKRGFHRLEPLDDSVEMSAHDSVRQVVLRR